MQRLWVCLVVCVLGPGSGARAEDEVVLVRPADNGAALLNPGMGWVFHYYDNFPAHYGSKLAPSDTLDGWPGLSVIYLRIPWSCVEPAEGRYNWSVLDTPAQRWIAKGKQVAFRISCSESWTRWATPQWVADAGAKGYNFRPGTGVQADGPFWEPDYDDPVFLAKLDRFLAAMAARYDGNPDVAFVDVGSLGVWGEGHTWASTKRPILPETVQRHIDLRQKHFKHTLLAANDDMGGPDASGDNPVIQYAAERGLTLRDDSILVQAGKRAYFHAAWAQTFWPKVPVILESEHYGGSKDRGVWQDGSLYLQAIEDYHGSYASIHWWPQEFLDANRELVRCINQRLGYRLQLVEAAWPRTIRAGGSFVVQSTQVQGFADQWKRAPVVFEWFGPYDYLLQRGWSFDRALEFMAGNHVTLINDNVGDVPPGQMPKLEQLARRAGYRFVLREVSHADAVARGETLTVNMKWSNVGAGKLYRRYSLELYLVDSTGAVVCQQEQAEIDPTGWLPGDQTVAAGLKVPTRLQTGRYTLGLALVEPTSRKPAIVHG